MADGVYVGSVIVFPERAVPWPISGADDITIRSLHKVTDSGCKILLIGCGPGFLLPPAALRRELRELGIILEWMDTGAACRTFNVLLAEDRNIAAALVAVE